MLSMGGAWYDDDDFSLLKDRPLLGDGAAGSQMLQPLGDGGLFSGIDEQFTGSNGGLFDDHFPTECENKSGASPTSGASVALQLELQEDLLCSIPTAAAMESELLAPDPYLYGGPTRSIPAASPASHAPLQTLRERYQVLSKRPTNSNNRQWLERKIQELESAAAAAAASAEIAERSSNSAFSNALQLPIMEFPSPAQRIAPSYVQQQQQQRQHQYQHHPGHQQVHRQQEYLLDDSEDSFDSLESSDFYLSTFAEAFSPIHARPEGKRVARPNRRYLSYVEDSFDSDGEPRSPKQGIPYASSSSALKQTRGAGRREVGGFKPKGKRKFDGSIRGTKYPKAKRALSLGDDDASDHDLMNRRRKHHNPWSLEETSALVAGVERCGGGKWADIKKLGFKAIESRSAVDLKDKWRNLMRVALIPNTATRVKCDKKREVPAALLDRVRELVALSEAGGKMKRMGQGAPPMGGRAYARSSARARAAAVAEPLGAPLVDSEP